MPSALLLQEGEEVGARSLQACHDRMNEVNAVVGIMQNVFMSEAPVVARRFFVRQFLTELFQHDASVVKVRCDPKSVLHTLLL